MYKTVHGTKGMCMAKGNDRRKETKKPKKVVAV